MAFCQTAVYRLACFEFLKIGYWWSWKMTFFGFWLLGFSTFFLFHLNENQPVFHMRYRLFLHCGWFLQNLEKDFIRTIMRTTVATKRPFLFSTQWSVLRASNR